MAGYGDGLQNDGVGKGGVEIDARGAGLWCLLDDPLTVAQVAMAAPDWLCLDQQHGAFDDASTLAAMQVLAGLPQRPPVAVRVPEDPGPAVGRAADAGADIVIVPMVETADRAQEVARAAFYPPRGARSWGPLNGLWGDTEVRREPEVWVMIETARALENLDQILAVDGVAGILVGPMDLSLALGTDPESLLAATGEDDPLPRVVAATRRAGKRPCMFLGVPEREPAARAIGFEAFAISTDIEAIARGVRGTLG